MAIGSYDMPGVAPLTLKDGNANYEGIHIAIVGADREGRLTELRSVKGGFRTGERFKLCQRLHNP